MNLLRKILLTLAGALVCAAPAAMQAQSKLNDKVLNRPYADMHAWHLGFSVGLHTQDMRFTHNGFVTDEGQQWFVEQPAFQPGFCVNGLLDLRLSTHFNFRFTPGLFFGNRDVTMREFQTGEQLKQSVKSAYLVFPLDIKFSALRYRNMRPYLIGGVMPALNLTRKEGEYLRLKPTDVYLTIGFGCDFYLPYFKLNPEIKFCFGLTDVLDHKRPDLEDDPGRQVITRSLSKAVSSMVVLSFFFE